MKFSCEQIAGWLLRISAAVLCLAIVPVFFPLSLMNTIHQSLGLGIIPSQPIFEYLARSASLMYFAHGLVVACVSTDVRRYWPFVGLLGGMNIFLGLALLIIDAQVGLPWFWTTFEGPPIAGLGAILLVLYWQGAKRHVAVHSDHGSALTR